LTENLERLAQDVYPALKTLHDLAYENKDALHEERTDRETAQEQADRRLDEAMTDGLLIALVGLLWTALAILLDFLGPVARTP
jgi:predicted RNase H-like nuclease